MTSLPKIQIPTQTFVLPIAKKKITYRRFTVREEKILLMASEGGTSADYLQAFKQVLRNCICEEDIDVESIPMFDLELLFLLLRINSVNSISDIKIRDVEDGETYDVSLDLQKIVTDVVKNTVVPEKTIQLTDDIGVVMRDLTISNFEGEIADNTDLKADDAFSLLGRMIEKVFDESNVYLVKDFSKEELTDFLLSFPPETMQKLEQYLEALPQLTYEHKYKRKDGSEGVLRFKGLADFFQFV